MNERVKKNIHMLNAFCCCSNQEKAQLLEILKPDTVHAITDCILNLLSGRIPLTRQQEENLKRKLSDKKEVVQTLIDPTTSHKEKRKLLIQHGSGLQALYPLLLPIIKKAAAELAAKILK